MELSRYNTIKTESIETSEQKGCFDKIASKIWPTGFKGEIKSVLKLAFPVILTNVSMTLIITESIMLCGHLDKYELDGTALGNSFINAFGISIGIGLCTACDTFFSQMFGSVSQKKRIGLMLQRSLLIVSLFPFIIWILFLNIEPIFIVIGQDPEVSRIAASYMALFSPGLFFAYHFQVLSRYLQNQDHMLPPMIIGIIGNVVNILTQYVALFQLGYGFEASALCQAFTYFFMWLMQLLYIIITKVYIDTWDGFTRESLLDWGDFCKLAVHGTAMVALETMCWEIGTFLTGLMGTTELGIQSILFQLQTTTFMISFGISVAVNIRVGQALGGNNPLKGITAYRTGLTVTLITTTTTGVLFIALADYLPLLFTTDSEIIAGSSQILVLLIFLQIMDGIGTVTYGALRGCGRQHIGTIFIIISYYFLGQPIGISLAFLTPLGVAGLWVGLLIALIFSVSAALFVVNYHQDWNKQAEMAQKRITQGLAKNIENADSDTTSNLNVVMQ